MTDIDTLRPEVAAAIRTMRGESGGNRDDAYDVIEVELLRLADECDELRTAYTSASQSRNHWRECVGRAEAELAALKDKHRGLLTGTTHDGRPYGLHGTPESVTAVSDELEELAALKTRIFQGIVLDVDDLARGHAGLPSEWRGKRVRLVVDEPAERGEG